MTFISTHVAMLLKYAGISFIAGAVNHGFFSEDRSLVTAGLGVLFYVLGAALEMRLAPELKKTWRDVLGVGIVLSIGLGFFTGGLQHFPDSPSRSLWVVPLGFVMSGIALFMQEGRGKIATKTLLIYGALSTLVVLAGSALGWKILQAPSKTVDRTITITMDDNMRFEPSSLSVKLSETVRFTLINNGKLRHEWVIGTPSQLQAHALSMKNAQTQSAEHSNHANAHEHTHDSAQASSNALSLAAGESGQLLKTFSDSTALEMACFEPGHYEAGMRGSIRVAP